MILHIDTTENSKILVFLEENGKVIVKKSTSAKYARGEKLLALVDKILNDNRLTVKNIKKIVINNIGGSFTSLRIGVVTANALGYALGVPVEGVRRDVAMQRLYRGRAKFNIVKPIYDREPNISGLRNPSPC
jgi:tRNA A37 threonylcarbamoyladenosine modification protein TsaB